MALQDIIAAISDRAEAEKQKLTAAAQTEMKQIAEEWDAKIEDKKQAIITEHKRMVAQKVQQSQFMIGNKIKTTAIDKKRTVINDVFEKAVDQLKNVSDAEYEKILSSLLAKLPTVSEAEVLVPAGKEKVTEKVLKAHNIDGKISKENITSIGGCIIRSGHLDVDFRFETILDQIKQDNIIDIANILFDEK